MGPKPDILQLATQYFRIHAWVYGIAAFLALTQMLRSIEWWFFWPLMIWTIVFVIHFMVFKSQTVSSEWVAERAARAADKAYDLSHIDSIRESPTSVSPRLKEKLADDETEAGADDAEVGDNEPETNDTGGKPP